MRKTNQELLSGSGEVTIENRTAKFNHTNHWSGVCVCGLGEVAGV